MYLKSLFILLLFVPFSSKAVTNLFQNTTGDDLWNTPGNWSLGILPDSTMLVSISLAAPLLKIPAGYHAKCHQLVVSNTVRVMAGGTLSVFNKIYITASPNELVNNGKIILKPGNFGINISTGGLLTNNDSDSILIQSTAKDPALLNNPIDCRGGFITNRGYIYISNSDELTALRMSHITNYYGKISNKGSGKIVIDQSVDSGLWLEDSLENLGIIEISHTTLVSNPSYKSSGIFLNGGFGKIINKGTFTINDTGDYGIDNDGGNLFNDVNGQITIIDFEEKGIYNKGIFTTFGDIDLDCTNVLNNNKGIHLENGSSFFRNGSNTSIVGNNMLDYGIYADRNFTNDTGSVVQIYSVKQNGFYTTTSLFTNHGTFEVNDCTTQYAIGVELINSVFGNYGVINVTNCYSGVRVYTGFTSNNYGQMVFKNLTSYGLNSNKNFYNRTGATINCFHNDGNPGFSQGIWHLKEAGTGDFTNDGAINILNLHMGIDLRTGNFINNGSLIMSNIKWGIEYGNFTEVSTFTNNGTCTIIGQNDAAAGSINIESISNNIYNFSNSATGNLNFIDCGMGIRIFSGGMKNEGNIYFRDITAKCIYSLPTSTVNYQFKNFSTGIIEIDTADYGVFFEVITSNTNRIPVINDGTIIFNHMTNAAIDGSNNYLGFTNNGTIAGTCILDCNFVNVQGSIKPGDNAIGIINPINFQSTNPHYYIDIKGMAGVGYPNGNDGILFSAAATLSGQLTVSLINNFSPLLGSEFIVFFANAGLSGTFSAVNLPVIASDREFEVQYLSDRVKLVVVPKYTLWTGAVSTAWNVAGNWSTNAIPDSNAYVKIVNVTNDPIIGAGTFVVNNGNAAANFRCKLLQIESGGVLTYNNTIVNNYGTVNVYGTIVHNDVSAGLIKNWTGSSMTVYTGGMVNMTQ
jgi:hypothetical protein